MRTAWKLARLAVRLATQPSSKVIRALAMSSNPPKTPTPTASTDRTGASTSDKTRSMSWIIRSRTTPMSVDRKVYVPKRSAAMYLGRNGTLSRVESAGLNRSMCPT